MSNWATLDDENNVVISTDINKTMASWVDSRRFVAQETAGDYMVSTVFLGIDLGFDGPPMWFETMLFGEGLPLDREYDRCTTWDEALAMHRRWVQIAIDGDHPL